MLAPGALARAASLTPASGWLHPCARTRLLRAQLDAPDDGLDDGFLDDGLDADFLDDGLDADYLDRQVCCKTPAESVLAHLHPLHKCVRSFAAIVRVSRPHPEPAQLDLRSALLVGRDPPSATEWLAQPVQRAHV